MDELDAVDLTRLARLGATVAREAAEGAGDPYRAALASFTDPDEIHALALRAWELRETY